MVFSPESLRQWTSSQTYILHISWLAHRPQPKALSELRHLCSFVLFFGLFLAEVEERLPKLWAESGGRLEREQDYSALYDYGERTFSTDLLILTAKDSSSDTNMLTKERLREYLNIHKKIFDEISVKHTPETTERVFTLNDICYKVPVTKSLVVQIMKSLQGNATGAAAMDDQTIDFLATALKPQIQNGMPCIRTTGIDCFKEGEYDFDTPEGLPSVVETFNSLAKQASPSGTQIDVAAEFAKYNIDLDTFKKRTSFLDNATSARDIRVAATGPCTGWAQLDAMVWPEPLIWGGVSVGNDGIIDTVKAFQSTWQIASYDMIAWRNGVSRDAAKTIVLEWNKKFVKTLREWNDAGSWPQPPISTS